MLSGIKVVGPGPVSRFEMDVETKPEPTPTPEPKPETKPEPLIAGKLEPTPKLEPASTFVPGPYLTSWAKYLNQESVCNMLWAIGEVFIREDDLTLKKLHHHWSRVAGGFYALVLLGKQGNLPDKQFGLLYGPNPRSRGPLPELYKELPQPADRQQTIRNLADLQALLTPEFLDKLKRGKYSAWFTYENRSISMIDILVLTIWSVGGLVEIPLGEEFTPEQKMYVDVIAAVHSHPTVKTDQIVAATKVKAHADFEKAYPSAP